MLPISKSYRDIIANNIVLTVINDKLYMVLKEDSSTGQSTLEPDRHFKTPIVEVDMSEHLLGIYGDLVLFIPPDIDSVAQIKTLDMPTVMRNLSAPDVKITSFPVDHITVDFTENLAPMLWRFMLFLEETRSMTIGFYYTPENPFLLVDPPIPNPADPTATAWIKHIEFDEDTNQFKPGKTELCKNVAFYADAFRPGLKRFIVMGPTYGPVSQRGTRDLNQHRQSDDRQQPPNSPDVRHSFSLPGQPKSIMAVFRREELLQLNKYTFRVVGLSGQSDMMTVRFDPTADAYDKAIRIAEAASGYVNKEHPNNIALIVDVDNPDDPEFFRILPQDSSIRFTIVPENSRYQRTPSRQLTE